MSKLKSKKLKVFFSVILISVLLYRALLVPIQFSTTAIVNAIGIDKKDSFYTVSMQILTPKFETGVVKNLEVIKKTNSSISNCLKGLALNIGKTLEFSHLNSIVISSDVAGEDNLDELLKPITKSRSLNQNAILLYTNELAEDILNIEETTNTIYEISKILTNKNQAYTSLKNKLLNKPVLLPIVSKEFIEESNISEENKTKKASLNYNGEMLANYKNNTLMLSSEQYENIMLFNKTQNLFLNADAQLGENLKVLNSKAKLKVEFYKGKPRLVVDLKLEVAKPLNSLLNNENKIKTVATNKIKTRLASGFNLLKEQNLDMFEFEKYFIAYKNKAWKNYKESLTKEESFFRYLEIFANVKVKLKKDKTLAY